MAFLIKKKKLNVSERRDKNTSDALELDWKEGLCIVPFVAKPLKGRLVVFSH